MDGYRNYPLPFAAQTVIGWPSLLLGATTLVVLAATWPGLRRLLERRALRWMGAVSFSLYLTHLPIVSALGHAFGPEHPWPAFLVSVPAALLVAWLFLLVVERPSHRLARWLARRVERAGGRRPEAPPADFKRARAEFSLLPATGRRMPVPIRPASRGEARAPLPALHLED